MMMKPITTIVKLINQNKFEDDDDDNVNAFNGSLPVHVYIIT